MHNSYLGRVKTALIPYLEIPHAGSCVENSSNLNIGAEMVSIHKGNKLFIFQVNLVVRDLELFKRI